MGAWSSPEANTFLFASPDRLWLRLMSAQSRGALSRGKMANSPAAHPNDQAANVEAFDPYSEFMLKYRQRRSDYAAQQAMRAGN
jgi:hypothetical protein